MNKPKTTEKKIVIAGGGFGGIQVALDLSKRKDLDAKIVLISDRPHFEYHPMLYRVTTGHSPLEVCIPLREIFKGRKVEIVDDSLAELDPVKKTFIGKFGSHYTYDFLVLALGSETTYFNIPGLGKYSFGFKTIEEALRLKRHLHEVFESCGNMPKGEGVCGTNIVVIGGGASGVELSGELAVYVKKLAVSHGLDPSIATVNLIEAAPRLIPGLPEKVSKRVKERLGALGVNVFLNRGITEDEHGLALFPDMKVKTPTLIWTAGVTPNQLYRGVKGFNYDKRGRVLVDDYLQAKGAENVFVMGDAASTIYAGMAQTAMHNGHYIADTIYRKVSRKALPKYVPKKPATALPVGPNWAVVLFGPFTFYGRLGWWLRKMADLRYFLSILPFSEALAIFKDGGTITESCPICGQSYTKEIKK